MQDIDYRCCFEAMTTQRTFERGISQRNISGWGVGLYILGETVKMVGGSVEVVSEAGQGACFVVWLPCAGPQAHATTPSPAKRRRPRPVAVKRHGSSHLR